jgi:hypothetical protein
MTYEPKTAPWKHQAEIFPTSSRLPLFFYQWEQRVGKTKPVIDTIAFWYEHPAGHVIDALLVVAMPGGVPANWVTDELPAHLPDRIDRMMIVWDAKKTKTKAFQGWLEALLNFHGLAVLAVNGEAVTTKAFNDFAVKFLRRRRVLFAADETTLIMKTPGIARTRAMHAYGRLLNKEIARSPLEALTDDRAKAIIGAGPGVVIKAIMDGTPVGEGPFDLYAQCMFLSHRILGYTSFFAFKNRYAKFTKGYRFDPVKQQKVEYPVLEEYQHLDELATHLAPWSSRITRKDAFPNMPPQVIIPVRFELTDEQRRVYDSLRDQYEAELRDKSIVTASHVLTRQLRLQQIASNVWPGEKGYAMCSCDGAGCEICDGVGAVEVQSKPRIIDPKHDARLECFEDQLSRTSEPFIVWCRFTRDVDQVLAVCEAKGVTAVRYDGLVSKEDKALNKAAFQSSTGPQGFIGNPTSGGRGLTLKRAKTVYNYSGFFSLLTYLQGNDRGEDVSLDQTKGDRGTAIVNLLAIDSVDEDIDEAHTVKGSVADMLLARRARGERVFR